MFGYQLVKRFPSPGYEFWEDWREHYLSTGMKLGWTEEEIMKWLPKKLCGWALNAVSDLPRGYWRSTLEKQAWTLTETLYQFDIRLSDYPLFYERSYSLFIGGKKGNRTEFSEPSDTAGQRTRQQCSQRQVIDTRNSAGVSLIDQFRQPGRSSEGFGIGSSCGLSRKGAFGKDLSGEVEDMSIAESGSRVRIPGDGHVQSDELSDEQSDDDNLFEDISDTGFSDVEEFNVNDARSETGFAASLNSVACDNVTAIASDFGGGVKASRDDILGAWALMELKTGGVDQKLCNATHVADETQMCKTECTVDTLENWTSPGGIDRQLVSERQKGQNKKTAVDRSNFAQMGKELEKWAQSQLHESQLCDSVFVEPTEEHQRQSAGVVSTWKSDHISMTTVLYSWFRDDQQPRREDSCRFLMQVEQKVERRIASRFTEIAKLLLKKRSLSQKERWSRLEASRQQSWHDYRRNGSYSGRRGGHPFKHLRKKVFMYR